MQIPLPTREIAWNAGEIGVAVMYLLMIVQGLVLAYVGTRRYLIWRSGRPYGPLGHVGARLRKTLGVVFLHQRLIRPGYVYAGIMHLFIFWGFLMLFIGTLIVLLEADIMRPYFGVSFYNGAFYVVYKLVINLFGLLFVVGLLDGASGAGTASVLSEIPAQLDRRCDRARPAALDGHERLPAAGAAAGRHRRTVRARALGLVSARAGVVERRCNRPPIDAWRDVVGAHAVKHGADRLHPHFEAVPHVQRPRQCLPARAGAQLGDTDHRQHRGAGALRRRQADRLQLEATGRRGRLHALWTLPRLLPHVQHRQAAQATPADRGDERLHGPPDQPAGGCRRAASLRSWRPGPRAGRRAASRRWRRCRGRRS